MKQKQKNSREAGEKRFDVIIDYLWGRPHRSSAESHHWKRICDWGIGDSTGGGGRER